MIKHKKKKGRQGQASHKPVVSNLKRKECHVALCKAGLNATSKLKLSLGFFFLSFGLQHSLSCSLHSQAAALSQDVPQK